jgi:sulfur relay (sulfurtransferase) complex TusBCD TusD component (DsrE family)
MAGYSRMAVSSTGACKRRVFPSIHLRGLSSSRVAGCLAFRVCCVPHAEYLPICVAYRWYMSMTEQDILQLLFYSETSSSSSSSSYVEQLLQFSQTWFSFCEVNELELSNSVCTTATSRRNLHTNNANTKSVAAAISAELETLLLIQARRHSINQATSPKVMLSCQSATPIKESHAQEVMCKDTECKIIRTNPNGYQFKWIWMLQRW